MPTFERGTELPVLRSVFVVFGVVLAVVFPWRASEAQTVTLNFASVSLTAGGCSDASPYLASFGITFNPTTPGATSQICNAPAAGTIMPTSSPNYFFINPALTNTNVSGDLVFSTPLTQVSFVTAAVSASTSVPAWDAQAYNASGTLLSSVSEPSLFPGPGALSFTLNGPGITRLHFDAFNSTARTFNFPPIDHITLGTPASTVTVSSTTTVGSNPQQAVVTPNGAEVYVTNYGSNTVSVIATATNSVSATVSVGGSPSSLSVSPDGSAVYIGNNTGSLSIINTATKTVSTLATSGPVRQLALTPDGSKVYLAMELDGLWQLVTSSNSLSQVNTTTCPEGAAVTPNGSTLYVNYQCFGPGGSSGHDALGIFSVGTNALLGSITGLPNVGESASISPNGLELWEVGGDACSSPAYDHVGCPAIPGVPEGVVNVIGTPGNSLIQSLGGFGGAYVSFSPDSARAFFATSSNLEIVDTNSFAVLDSLAIPASGSVAFTPDGTRAYAPLPSLNQVAVLSLSSSQSGGQANGDIRLVAIPYSNSVGPIAVQWTPAFPDANYTAVCTAETTIGDFLLPTITARSATGMQVSPSDGGPSVGTLDCIGIPDSDSSDLRHARASFSGSPTSVTVTWGTGFPDSNYTVSCTVETEGSFTGGFTSVINSITPTSVTAINGGFATGTMHCIAVPDSDTSNLRHARVPVTGGQTVIVPWNPALPSTTYVAVCSDVAIGASASDSAIAILATSKLTSSMAVIPEIPNGDLVHCIAVPTNSTLAITAVALPSGEVGVGYSATLEATGGTPPYTWTVASGSLPPGIALSSTGVLSGPPTTANTYNFTVQVTDSASAMATQAFAITIVPAGTGQASATIQPTSLSFGNQVVTTKSTPQAVTITSNGTAPFLISSIAVIDTNPTDFPETNNCPLAPTGLGPGESCQIFVAFAPIAYGARSATLIISDNQGNVPGSQQSVLLTGTGVDIPPVASTTYNITGNPFTVFTGSATCPPDCNITGSFTLAQPLPPNLSNATITPASFSFTVGTTNLTQANLTSASFTSISTDASGYITSWAISLSNANFSMVTNNTPGNVNDSFTIVSPQGSASNANSPATWPKTVVTPLTFNASPTPVSNNAVLNCASGTVPCTDPNAHSLKLTVSAVSTGFTLTVTSVEVPASQANGVCETGNTATNDFDCRFVGYFTLQNNANGVVVPQCIPYSNGNCVYYRVSNTPPESYYTPGVLEYIAWNNTSYAPPQFYNANNPRLFDDPDDPPYDINHQFVFDITTYYKPTGNYVGVDNGIGGGTKHFNDFVVAYPAAPSYSYTLSFVPPLSSTRTAYFERGDSITAKFKLSPNTPAGIAMQAPHHVGYSVLLDTNKTGCGDYSGTIEPTATPGDEPVDFTYDTERQFYELRLRGIYPAGQYKMLLSSDLAPEQCAVFVVTKDD